MNCTEQRTDCSRLRGPLIEKNFFKGCAYGGSGNACFSFHCDDALFQFNESCFTRYNPGDTDATGFDSDYCCRRSVFQYNYSHDNEYGFMVVCSQPPNGFNDGTIVRYNISQNDGGNVFRFSGNITNTEDLQQHDLRRPENDEPGQRAIRRAIIYSKSWNRGWSDRLNFQDNVVYQSLQECDIRIGQEQATTSIRTICSSASIPRREPKDSTRYSSDPRLVNPGRARTWNRIGDCRVFVAGRVRQKSARVRH